MEDKAIYDLKSLKWVILGIMISSISIFLQMGTGLVDTDLSSIVILFSVVKIIGWIIVILGLRKIREYGKFNKCYTSSLWVLAMMVVGFMSIILLAILIAFYYYLFKSLEDIALQLKENTFAKLADRIFMVSAWIFILALCIMPISAFIFKALQPMFIDILIIITAVICLVICSFIYLAYKKLDGREIPNTKAFQCDDNNLELKNMGD
ncbi:hypothetical protein [Aminipila sp.]|uniref:hypothetical protein n=1 Tax=Aminipila sp. TaxID=2060095 RepID=UPI00289F6138|nr:hypothetical protein [Aminipila sp.]